MVRIKADDVGKEAAIRILSTYLKSGGCSEVIILTEEDKEYRKEESQTEYKNIEECTGSILKELGIPLSLKGHQYLKDAISICAENDFEIPKITKVLYPEISKKRNTAPNCVERGIRHAIETTWERGNLEKIDSMFSYTVSADKGKPTNHEFIAVLLEEVRMRGIKNED